MYDPNDVYSHKNIDVCDQVKHLRTGLLGQVSVRISGGRYDFFTVSWSNGTRSNVYEYDVELAACKKCGEPRESPEGWIDLDKFGRCDDCQGKAELAGVIVTEDDGELDL